MTEAQVFSDDVASSLGMDDLKFLIAVDSHGNYRQFVRQGGELIHDEGECDEQVTTATLDIQTGLCKKNLQIKCTWIKVNGVWVCR